MKKVLDNSYTMCTRGSPDIYTLSPRALGVYIRQTTRAHGITIKYTNNGKRMLCEIYNNYDMTIAMCYVHVLHMHILYITAIVCMQLRVR